MSLLITCDLHTNIMGPSFFTALLPSLNVSIPGFGTPNYYGIGFPEVALKMLLHCHECESSHSQAFTHMFPVFMKAHSQALRLTLQSSFPDSYIHVSCFPESWEGEGLGTRLKAGRVRDGSEAESWEGEGLGTRLKAGRARDWERG